MKTILIFAIGLWLFAEEVQSNVDPKVLVGVWQLDMTPQDSSDDNFAMMEITKINDDEMKGTFYREGVKLREGKINYLTGVLYGALVSKDNSGAYNTSFYYEDGVLYGTTHAIDRGFLSVWTAVKSEEN